MTPDFAPSVPENNPVEFELDRTSSMSSFAPATNSNGINSSSLGPSPEIRPSPAGLARRATGSRRTKSAESSPSMTRAGPSDWVRDKPQMRRVGSRERLTSVPPRSVVGSRSPRPQFPPELLLGGRVPRGPPLLTNFRKWRTPDMISAVLENLPVEFELDSSQLPSPLRDQKRADKSAKGELLHKNMSCPAELWAKGDVSERPPTTGGSGAVGRGSAPAGAGVGIGIVPAPAGLAAEHGTNSPPVSRGLQALGHSRSVMVRQPHKTDPASPGPTQLVV
eukprot:SAG22_NODE_1655_length_3892_cov_2.729765_2_plen_278_part_00